jgi:hypothetical protein
MHPGLMFFNAFSFAAALKDHFFPWRDTPSDRNSAKFWLCSSNFSLNQAGENPTSNYLKCDNC